MTRPVVALCFSAAALVGVVGAAQATLPHHGSEPALAATSERVPVEGTTLVCPRTSSSTAASDRLALVAPAAVGSGIAEARARDPRTPLPPLALTRAGTTAITDSRGVSVEPIVAARGTLASGVVGDTAQRIDDGPSRSISGARCTAPATSFWFVGASTTAGRDSRLSLTNVEPLPATVDVTFAGPKGSVDAPTSRGITVAPGETRLLDLQTIVPDETDLLVRVVARAGRVAAFLRQHVLYAKTPGGIDFIPSVDAPTTTAVVPGLPNGTGVRRVLLANPGVDDATAKLTLVTSDGTFVPEGLGAVSIDAGTTKSVDITAALAQQAGAVAVQSDRPLVVSALADTGPRLNGIGEFAWTAAVPPLEGPTPVGVTTIGRGKSTLFLSAPQGGGTVLVSTLGAGGRYIQQAREWQVPAGRTVSVELPVPVRGDFSAVLELVGGTGPVYAARELLELGGRGPLYTIEPIRSGRGTAVLRTVVSDVTASAAR